VVLRLLDIMRESAKARQQLSPGRPKKGQANLPGHSDNVVHFPTDSAQVRDEVAKAADVSSLTLNGHLAQELRNML
jgi:hypothetical protein